MGIGRFLQGSRDAGWGRIRLWIGHAKKAIRRSAAFLWSHIYLARYRIAASRTRYGATIFVLVLLLLIGATVYSTPTIQNTLEPYFATDQRLEGLRSLLLTLGGALTGAAAIAFSLVMFAMQVNVERMPYGLFRRFCSDPKLLGSFMCTFLLAIAVAALSLIPGKSWPWLAIGIVGAGWGTVLILVLFLYAYRRALFLINPLSQLTVLLNDARRQMRRWDRRARRAAPLLDPPEESTPKHASLLDTSYDLPRVAFFWLNPHWTNAARQAILHAVSFARRFAEQGDHEAPAAALDVVVRINAAYVEAKGRTFFSNPPLFADPLATDGFINETLEHLRQNVRIGVSRGDECQIEQTFKAMADLVRVYLCIDYSNEYVSKTHAYLAAGYLSQAVQSVVPHNMADVIMEGIRIMGESAQLLLIRARPDDIATLAEKISLIACAGIAKEEYRPVTQTGVEQLARLTINLIQTKEYDIRYAASVLKKHMSAVAKIFLNLPDTPLLNIHSTYLAPYYSSTNTQTLLAWLTNLVNACVQAKEDDEDARAIVGNIEHWADQLYQTEKDLLLLAIEKKSFFTFDLIYWIAHITKLLLAASNAPACGKGTRDPLRRHAIWLISVLSWVPCDQETVEFIENCQMTETLFESAMDAHDRNCVEVSNRIRDLLLSWAFKAGKYQTGWAILERCMYGLATLALVANEATECDRLKAAISERLGKEGVPDQEIRVRTARNIRRRAATLYQEGHSFSRIENAMSQVNQDQLRCVLNDIANVLSPNTAGEPDHPQL